jgi:hypothetical protein
MLDFIAPMLVALGLFALIGWIVWVVMQKRRLEVQVGVHTRLLERFQSPGELAAFFDTPGGERLLSSLSAAPPRVHSLGSLRAGIVLGFLGIALLGLEPAVRGSQGDLAILGAIVLAVGLGLVAAAFASHRLARAWGLLATERPGAVGRPSD